jgi:hypothetical protein
MKYDVEFCLQTPRLVLISYTVAMLVNLFRFHASF